MMILSSLLFGVAIGNCYGALAHEVDGFRITDRRAGNQPLDRPAVHTAQFLHAVRSANLLCR